MSELLSWQLMLSTNFSPPMFPSEKLSGGLNYASMDHGQTSVQEQIAIIDVKTEQKMSNYC